GAQNRPPGDGGRVLRPRQLRRGRDSPCDGLPLRERPHRLLLPRRPPPPPRRQAHPHPDERPARRRRRPPPRRHHRRRALAAIGAPRPDYPLRAQRTRTATEGIVLEQRPRARLPPETIPFLFVSFAPFVSFVLTSEGDPNAPNPRARKL